MYLAEFFCDGFSLADFAVHGFSSLSCWLFGGCGLLCYFLSIPPLFIDSIEGSLRFALLHGWKHEFAKTVQR